MPSFKMKFSGVTILQGVEFSIFPIDFELALQQCSATALPVIQALYRSTCYSQHPKLRTGEFCWCRVLPPASVGLRASFSTADKSPINVNGRLICTGKTGPKTLWTWGNSENRGPLPTGTLSLNWDDSWKCKNWRKNTKWLLHTI